MWFPFNCLLYLIDGEEDERHSIIPGFHHPFSWENSVVRQRIPGSSTLIEGSGVANCSKILCN